MTQQHTHSEPAQGQLTKLVPADSDDSGRFRQIRRTPDDVGSADDTDHGAAGATVSGRVFLAIPEAIAEMSGSFEGFTRQLLSDAGLTDLRADDWYPQTALVRVLAHLQKRVGAQTIERLGRFLPTVLPWSDSVTALRDALQSLDGWYGTWNHSDGDTVQFSPVADRRAALLLDTPYPPEFERGLVRGLVCRFDSTGAQVRTRFYEPATDNNTVCRFTFGGSVTR